MASSPHAYDDPTGELTDANGPDLVHRHVLEPDAISDHADHVLPEGEGPEQDVGSRFDLNWRGYDRGQVDAYLRTWGYDYWATKNERDALLAEVERLRAEPPTQLSPLSSMSRRLQDIVAAAEEEAEALRHESRAAADEVLTAARSTAETDLSAAAAERSVAIGEADRVTREARTAAKQLVDEAHEEAERSAAEARDTATRLLEKAQSQATRLVAEAQAEAAETRRLVAEEADELRSAARAESDELTRSTARQREIAEAEHQRLLTAHASQQRHFSDGLRREIAELQAEAERLTTEVERRRTALIAADPSIPVASLTPPTAVPPTASTLLSPAEVQSAQTGLAEGADSSIDDLLHDPDTGEAYVGEQTSIFERFPRIGDLPTPASAIEALRRHGHRETSPTDDEEDYADALDLVAERRPDRD